MKHYKVLLDISAECENDLKELLLDDSKNLSLNDSDIEWFTEYATT